MVTNTPEYQREYRARHKQPLPDIPCAICGDARDAFEQAGIGRDAFDEILLMYVAPEYQHLVDG